MTDTYQLKLPEYLCSAPLLSQCPKCKTKYFTIPKPSIEQSLEE